MEEPPQRAPAALKKTSIKLPGGLWKRFRIHALEKGRDASAILAELIEQHLAPEEERVERVELDRRTVAGRRWPRRAVEIRCERVLTALETAIDYAPELLDEMTRTGKDTTAFRKALVRLRRRMRYLGKGGDRG